MKHRMCLLTLFVLLIATSWRTTIGQTPAAADAPPSTAPTAPALPVSKPLPSMDERLATLSPANASGYFLLGEEAQDENQLELAVRLFVLAASLDGERFGRSACLALAEIEKQRNQPMAESDLRSLASLLTGSSGGDSSDSLGIKAAQREYRRSASLLSAMLGFYRQGEGQKALAALDLNAATERLVKEFSRSFGSIGQIISFCRNYPRCPTCRNEHLIVCPTCHGHSAPGHCKLCDGQHYVLCPTCNGTPGEHVNKDELDSMLLFEVALQSGDGASWSARIAVDQARARPVLDLSMLPRWYDINTAMTLYRDNEWVMP